MPQNPAIPQPVAFLGLGDLGLPIAANLLDSGVPLSVWNRTPEKAKPLTDRGARLAATPADAVTSGGVVGTLLWDDNSVEEVVHSTGFLEKLGPGGIHIGMTTNSPDVAHRLAALHAGHGSIYVEATVFGRPEAAVARQLYIQTAGPAAAKDRVAPLFPSMGAQRVFDFGEEIGAASIVKIVGNFLLVSASRSLVEAFTTLRASGVDPQAALDMYTQSLFNAPIYKGYGQRIVNREPAFTQTAIPRKDLGLFQTLAQNLNEPSPVADTLQQLFRSAD